MTIDLTKTLDELEGTPIGEPTYSSSLVIQVCSLYKNKRVCDYTASDFRIIIGQKFSLNFLIPPAIQMLKQNPWVAGDYYDGDLLAAVLAAPDHYWTNNPEQLRDMLTIIEMACNYPEDVLCECSCPAMRHFLRKYSPGSPFPGIAEKL
jgi:hypothetical protein